MVRLSVPRIIAGVLGLAFVALCLTPCWLRLKNPTIYADDVVRIEQLQTQPLSRLLFRPFNEHMAPMFEVVTWTAWQLGECRLSNAPVALLLASFVPFAATLAMLGLVIRREVGSFTSAMATVAVFALASVDGEVVNWYSASSFTWASALTLLGWLGAAEAAQARRTRDLAFWLTLSGLGAFFAPGFCAIGLLSGPLAALRLMFDGSTNRKRKWFGGLVPIAGTVSYLIGCDLFRYRDVLASGLGRHVDTSLAIWNLARAPIDVLIPGLVGIKNLDRLLPDWFEFCAAGLLVILLGGWALFRPGQRSLILGGLCLIVGGYGVTYGVRTLPDARQLINVQRYHLFPQLGLAFLIAPAMAAGFRQFDGRPVGRWVLINAWTVVLIWAHLPQMKEHLRFFRFPEQRATLEALDRLTSVADREGISRDQILSALDPIRPGWVPSDGNALKLLPLSIARSGQTEPAIRSALLARFSTRDREALCGGMDASVYRVPSPVLAGSRTPAQVHLVARSRVQPVGPDRFESAGWPAYLEYEVGPDADDARALAIPDVRTRHDLELWWADADGQWSPNRTVWWRPGPDQDWAVPLDRLPHWRAGHVRRLRVYFHEPGAIALGQPKLLR